jgi:ATP-binding cassette subfamily B protein
MVVIMMVRMVIYAPIIGVGGVILALNKSTSMWWIIALAVLVLIGMIMVLFSAAMPRFKIMQTLVDRLNLVMRENLSGMMVIRAFNMQPFEEQRFDQANRNLTDTSLFVNRLMVIMMPAMMLIMNATSMLIIWVGAHQVAQSAMQVGDMMAFMQYAIQIVFSFLMVSMMFIMLPRAAVSADRIADVIETEPAIRDPQAPLPMPAPSQGARRVPQRVVPLSRRRKGCLARHQLRARPGETTAIIGPPARANRRWST